MARNESRQGRDLNTVKVGDVADGAEAGTDGLGERRQGQDTQWPPTTLVRRPAGAPTSTRPRDPAAAVVVLRDALESTNALRLLAVAVARLPSRAPP